VSVAAGALFQAWRHGTGRIWHLKLMTLCVRREATRLSAEPVADYYPSGWD